jgi:uncharacterized protein with FMN-binding domain
MNPKPKPSLARRAFPALVLTSASGLLLSALDRPNSTVDASAGDASAASTVTVGTTTIVTTPSTTAAPATVATTATGADTTAASATTAVATTAVVTSTVPATPVCTTITGPSVSTKFGPVQVEASVAADGTICSVDAIVTPADDGKSVRINDRAVPVLNSSAMSAQSATFNGVSGATYTSNAYQHSLQAILDSVG